MCLVDKQRLNGTDFSKSSRTAGRPTFRPPASVADGWKKSTSCVDAVRSMKKNVRNSGKCKSISRTVFHNLDWNFSRAALSFCTVYSTTSYVWTKSEPTDWTFAQTSWSQLKWTRTSWNKVLRMMGRGYTGTWFRSKVSDFTAKVEIILKTAKSSAERFKCEDCFLFPSSVGILCTSIVCFSKRSGSETNLPKQISHFTFSVQLTNK